MSQKNDKFSTQYENFWNKYVISSMNKSEEEKAFMLGYYAHLITDMEYYRLMNDPKLTLRSFELIKQNDDMYQKIANKPETIQTLKQVFETHNMAVDAYCWERDYIITHPESSFETILRKTKEFPDYLDYLPEGAITRKLKIVDQEYDFSNFGPTPAIKYFYSDEDLQEIVERTAKIVYEKIKSGQEN